MQEKIDVRTYDVIYEALDEVKAAMSGLLSPDLVEKYLGKLEFGKFFNISKVGTIAGSYVTDGKVTRGANAKLLRSGNWSSKESSIRSNVSKTTSKKSSLATNVALA